MTDGDDQPAAWPVQGLGNCDEVAQEVHDRVGGEIRAIRPRLNRPRLGRSVHDPDGSWAYHAVVVREGLVFDAFTGPDGLSSVEYKELFDERDEIDFDF